MPYMATTTNVKLSKEQRAALERRMGKAIETIPGKSERWLMLSFRDETPMAFQGSEAPCAVCEVKIYGHADARDYSRLTGEICAMLKDVCALPENRVYVTYQEVEHWGFDGENF